MTTTTPTPDALAFMRAHVEDYDRTAAHYPYQLPTNALRFPSLAALKNAVTRSESNYFDRESVRHFRGITSRRFIGGRFFIDSIQFEDSDGTIYPREWRVRYVYALPAGMSTVLMVETVGRGDWPTEEDAATFAREVARVLS